MFKRYRRERKLLHEKQEQLAEQQDSFAQTIQSIDNTLKRLEILIVEDIQNRSVFFDVPMFYRRMSKANLVDSRVAQEWTVFRQQDL